MSKECKCLTCPYFDINYDFGIMIMNCFYSDGKKDSVIFNIDTSKGTPKNCPLEEKENELS